MIQLCSLGPSRRAGACRPHPASPWAALPCEFVPVSSVAVPCLVTGAFPCPQVAASSRSFPTVNLPLLSKFRQRITTHRSLLLKQGGLALGSALRTYLMISSLKTGAMSAFAVILSSTLNAQLTHQHIITTVFSEQMNSSHGLYLSDFRPSAHQKPYWFICLAPLFSCVFDGRACWITPNK